MHINLDDEITFSSKYIDKYIETININTELKINIVYDCYNNKNNVSKKEFEYMYDKLKLKEKARDFYLQKAIEFIKTFFILLDNQNYDEAYEFLKGDSGKYFGKQRLNTFFKNTKSIIGHLEIFISLYQLFFYSRLNLFNY